MFLDKKSLSSNVAARPLKKDQVPTFPEEIDLYNFFEKWGGLAQMFDEKGNAIYRKTIQGYLSEYNFCCKINYNIESSRYYALNFKDRGTFLVSEKRYKELKVKKGGTV